MTAFWKFSAIALMLLVAACGTGKGPVGSAPGGWNLQDISVKFGPEISRTASGDEFTSNFVWNGFNEGNRKRQVIGIFKRAMREVGRETMQGTRPVNMNVQVNYFHALTEFSRLWCCGQHKILADVAVVDAASGDVLASVENLSMGRIALGGIPGLVAVAAGRDQEVRVHESMVNSTREWLSKY
ncbi:MAG: DUF6778 family protein [Paracoccaceae bacterium]